MQQEMNRQRRQTMPDNDKVMERVRSPIDSNKLSMETQTTPASPMKSKEDKTHNRTKSFGQSFSCLSNSSRGSYISIVEYSPTPRRSVSLRKRPEESEKIPIDPINKTYEKEKMALKRKPFTNLKMHAGMKKGQKNEGKENVEVKNPEMLNLKNEKNLKFDNISVSSSDRNLSRESGKKNSTFSFLRRKSKKKECTRDVNNKKKK